MKRLWLLGLLLLGACSTRAVVLAEANGGSENKCSLLCSYRVRVLDGDRIVAVTVRACGYLVGDTIVVGGL